MAATSKMTEPKAAEASRLLISTSARGNQHPGRIGVFTHHTIPSTYDLLPTLFLRQTGARERFTMPHYTHCRRVAVLGALPPLPPAFMPLPAKLSVVRDKFHQTSSVLGRLPNKHGAATHTPHTCGLEKVPLEKTFRRQ